MRHGLIKSIACDRLYLVLSGAGTFNIDAEEVRVEAEDLLMIPRGTPYDYWRTMSLLLVHSPANVDEAETDLEDPRFRFRYLPVLAEQRLSLPLLRHGLAVRLVRSATGGGSCILFCRLDARCVSTACPLGRGRAAIGRVSRVPVLDRGCRAVRKTPG